MTIQQLHSVRRGLLRRRRAMRWSESDERLLRRVLELIDAAELPEAIEASRRIETRINEIEREILRAIKS